MKYIIPILIFILLVSGISFSDSSSSFYLQLSHYESLSIQNHAYSSMLNSNYSKKLDETCKRTQSALEILTESIAIDVIKDLSQDNTDKINYIITNLRTPEHASRYSELLQAIQELLVMEINRTHNSRYIKYQEEIEMTSSDMEKSRTNADFKTPNNSVLIVKEVDPSPDPMATETLFTSNESVAFRELPCESSVEVQKFINNPSYKYFFKPKFLNKGTDTHLFNTFNIDPSNYSDDPENPEIDVLPPYKARSMTCDIISPDGKKLVHPNSNGYLLFGWGIYFSTYQNVLIYYDNISQEWKACFFGSSETITLEKPPYGKWTFIWRDVTEEANGTHTNQVIKTHELYLEDDSSGDNPSESDACNLTDCNNNKILEGYEELRKLLKIGGLPFDIVLRLVDHLNSSIPEEDIYSAGKHFTSLDENISSPKIQDGKETIERTDMNGDKTEFEKSDDTTYVCKFRPAAKITITSDGYVYTDEQGNKTLYSTPSGNNYVWSKKIAANGDQVIPEYKTVSRNTNRISSVKDKFGRITRFEYDSNGHLTKITDYNNRITLITVDSDGKLTEVNDKGRITRYEYFADGNESGKIKKIIMAAGTSAAIYREYTYYDDGRIKTLRDFNGETTSYSYGDAKTVITTNNQKTTYTFYKGGAIKSVQYGEQKPIEYVWRGFGTLANKTDQYGRKTEFSYDSNANLQVMKRPDGKSIKMEYSPDNMISGYTDYNGSKYDIEYENGNPTVIKDLSDPSKITKITYNTKNLVTKITRPDNNNLYYDYNKYGQLIRMEIGETNRIVYTYEWDGDNLRKIFTAGTLTLEYFYNEFDEVIAIRDYSGNPGYFETKYEYNGLGQVISVTNPENGAIKYTYQNGMPKSVIENPNSSYAMKEKTVYNYIFGSQKKVEITERGIFDIKTTVSYDSAGRTSSVVSSNGAVNQQFVYDDENMTVTVVNNNGGKLKQVEYKYNLIDLPEKVTYTGKTGTVSESYSYYDDGKIKSHSDIYGKKTEYFYDASGNLISVKKGKEEQKFAYDSNNRLATVFLNNATVQSSYYDNGLLKSVDYSNNRKILYEYNSFGDISRIIDSAAGKDAVTEYEYYAPSLVKEIKRYFDGKTLKQSFSYNKNKQPIKITDAQGTISRKYDTLGKLTEVLDRTGRQTLFQYNDSNLVDMVLGNGRRTKYEYNNRNLLSSVSNGANLEFKTTYDYDIDGNISKVVRSNGAETVNLEHDFLGRMTQYSLDGVYTANYYYSSDTVTKLFNGNQIIYRMNPEGRVAKEEIYNGSQLFDDISYDYDTFGNLISAKSNSFELKYEYDSFNNRTLVEIPTLGLKTKYDYYPNGLRSKMTTPGGRTTNYKYNELGMVTEIEKNGLKAQYTYNESGLPETKTLPNKITTNYEYSKGLLHKISSQLPSGVKSIEYTYNEFNEIIGKTYENGKKDSFEYLDPGFLKKATYADGLVEEFKYDTKGRRSQYSSSIKGTIDYSYSDSGLLTRAGNKTFNWSNGMITKEEENGNAKEYIYDAKNRLSKVIFPDNDFEEYGYCPFDNIVSKRNSKTKEKTLYLYDGEDVVGEIGKDGIIQKETVHGLGTDEPLWMTTKKGRRYYTADNLGSVTTLTDDMGNISDEYTYRAFGEFEHENTYASEGENDVANDYGYTGRTFSESTGLMNYRSRFYDPSLGIFTQADRYPEAMMRSASGGGGMAIPSLPVAGCPSCGLNGGMSMTAGANYGMLYNPGMFGHYQYVNNSPLNFVDPFGYGPRDMDWRFWAIENRPQMDNRPLMVAAEAMEPERNYRRNEIIYFTDSLDVSPFTRTMLEGFLTTSVDVAFGTVQGPLSIGAGVGNLYEKYQLDTYDWRDVAFGYADALFISTIGVKGSTVAIKAIRSAKSNSCPAENLSNSADTIKNPVIGKPRVGSGLKNDSAKPKVLDGDNYGRPMIQESVPKAKAHGFPDLLDNYVNHAKEFPLDNGAKLYQIKGSYNGIDGRFEWIIQDGNVTHRQFVRGGNLTGVPIKP